MIFSRGRGWNSSSPRRPKYPSCPTSPISSTSRTWPIPMPVSPVPCPGILRREEVEVAAVAEAEATTVWSIGYTQPLRQIFHHHDWIYWSTRWRRQSHPPYCTIRRGSVPLPPPAIAPPLPLPGPPNPAWCWQRRTTAPTTSSSSYSSRRSTRWTPSSCHCHRDRTRILARARSTRHMHRTLCRPRWVAGRHPAVGSRPPYRQPPAQELCLVRVLGLGLGLLGVAPWWWVLLTTWWWVVVSCFSPPRRSCLSNRVSHSYTDTHTPTHTKVNT